MRARPVPWSYVAADPARRPIIVPLRNQSNKGKVFSKVLPFVHDGGTKGIQTINLTGDFKLMF